MSQVIKRIGALSYERCDAVLAGKMVKSVGPNTWIEREREDNGGICFVVRFHNTQIMRLSSDGAVLLYTGGFKSVTTKQRLSALSPVHVHQTQGEWFVGHQKFYEGMNVGKPRTEKESLEKGMREGDEVAAKMLQDMEQGI